MRGSSKIKRELKDGETDGTRKAGDTDGGHIASIKEPQMDMGS